MTRIAEIVQALIKGLGSAEAVAEHIGGGLSARSVQHHADGERVPVANLAAKYIAAHAARHERIADEEPTVATFDPTRPTLEAVQRAAAQAEALLVKSMNDADASYRDRAGALHALSRTLRDLASLRGELEPTEASILRTPAWARLRDLTLEILRDHPDAARALHTAWSSLEG